MPENPYQNARQPNLAQSRNRTRRVLSNGIGHQHDGGHFSIDRNEDTERGKRFCLACGFKGPFRQGRIPQHQSAGPSLDETALHHPFNAGAAIFPHLLRRGERQSPRPGKINQRSGQHMMRGLFERSEQAQRIILRQAGPRHDCCKARAALHQHPGTGSTRNTADEGDRGGQNERTGRGHNEHRQSAHRITGEKPCKPHDDECDRKEKQRETIRKPHERSLGGACRLHHAHNTCIGAVCRRSRRVITKGFARIHRAGAQGLTGRALNGDRLTGHRALINPCQRVRQRAIHRKKLASAHQKKIAGVHLVDGDIDEIAAGIHDGDDSGRKRLSQRHARRHGNKRNVIHPSRPARKSCSMDQASRRMTGKAAAEKSGLASDAAPKSGAHNPAARPRAATRKKMA